MKNSHSFLHLLIASLISLTAAIFVYFLIRFVTRKILTVLSQHHTDRIIKRDINLLSLSGSLFLILSLSGTVFCYYYDLGMQFNHWLEKISTALLLMTSLMILYLLIDIVTAKFKQNDNLRKLALKSYNQIFKIILLIIFSLLAASFLFGKDPWAIITGIAAMTTLLTFMFKDTILGVVSSIQIAFNNTVKVGDWLEFKQYHANGNVMEITLTTVKIKNFDNTMSYIPTYALLSESYRNWQAMIDTQSRRINFTLLLNADTVKSLTPELEKKLTQKNYPIKSSSQWFESGQTNLGLYRHYMFQLMKMNPDLYAEQAQLIVDQSPGANGLPLQVIAYCRHTATKDFQEVQSILIEHILVTLGDFELQVFQNATEPLLLSD